MIEWLAVLLRRARPGPPVSFGYKTAWLAIRTGEMAAVARTVPGRRRAVNWEEGLRAEGVFVSPPIGDWLFVVGAWTAADGLAGAERRAMDWSRLFGETHSYATHRVTEYHQWVMAKDGVLLRSFAYSGESGEVLADRGAPTETEQAAGVLGRPVNEADVMKIAAGWSLDPTQLSVHSGPAALGVLISVD